MPKPVLIALLIALILTSGSYFIFKSNSSAGDNNSFLAQIFDPVKKIIDGTIDLTRKTFSKSEEFVEEISLYSKGGELKKDFNNQNVSERIKTACSFDKPKGFLALPVIINEVAWMGTKENFNHEWIELKNTNKDSVNISNWQLLDKEEQINIIFPAGSEIGGNGFFVLGRGEDVVADKTDLIYSGSLKNSDEGLRLFDANCNLVDEILANPNWPAGDNTAKKTMERDSETRNWHTSAVIGGTPKKENRDFNK
ncbi:MAG: lamin tail domain-containing protein [Patescibacteria group bacterium]|nr:lamin tail domain-containing protein [Patescibacteria group bacterium]